MPAESTISPEVLLLGDPALRRTASSVALQADRDFEGQLAALRACLHQFRARHGFGRAIAAPQIGIAKRFIALHLDGRDWAMVNPEITYHSPERFSLWDDCMSFPELLVKVFRYASISVKFQDENAEVHHWLDLDRSTSELLQHEIDHLDGILAVDRAEGSDAVINRRDFSADPQRYLAQVDR